jgi:hypothetical protein
VDTSKSSELRNHHEPAPWQRHRARRTRRRRTAGWPVLADDTAPDSSTKRDEQETELVTPQDDADRDDLDRDGTRDATTS